MLVRGVIDRFEENYAVILLGAKEKKINWPKEFLPQGAKESQVICFTLKIDHEATSTLEKETAELWQKITN